MKFTTSLFVTIQGLMVIKKTEYDFMKDLLMDAFKVVNDQALAKELFQQV